VPVTVAVPTATPVNFAVHVPDDKVQLAPTVPTRVFEDTKLTEPPGVFDAVVVSVTVAVQVEVPVGMMVPGLQATLTAVLSLLVIVTVIVAAVLVLVL
jgi:hypothetical protein